MITRIVGQEVVGAGGSSGFDGIYGHQVSHAQSLPDRCKEADEKIAYLDLGGLG